MGRKVFKSIIRILIISVIFLVVFVPLFLFIIVRIPSVQKFALDKVNTALSNKLQTKVKIQRIVFDIPSGVRLEKFYVEDKNKDTLLYTEELSVQLNLLNLINKKLVVSDLKIANAIINLSRKSGQKDFNYSFIANSLNDSSDEDSDWKFDLQKISLKSIKLNYKDIPGGLSVHSSIGLLTGSLKDLGMDDHDLIIKHIKADQLLLSLSISNQEYINDNSNPQNKQKLVFENLSLKRSKVIYNNYTQKAKSSGLDFNRLKIDSLNALLEDVSIGDTILFNVRKFSAKESSGFAVNKLEGNFSLTQNDLIINKVKVHTPNSYIDNPLTLKIPLGDESIFGEFSAKGNLNKESIAIADLSFFIPELDTLSILKNKNLSISGKVSGKISDFSFDNFHLSLDKNNFIEGNIGARGLPDIPNANFDLNIKKMMIDSAMLAYINSYNDSFINLKSLERLSLEGSLRGKLSSSNVDISINTSNGVAEVNGKINLDSNFSFKGFKGNASVSGLNLGEVFRELDQFGNVSLKTSIDTYNNSLTQIDASISELKFNDYTYHNIKINGNKVENNFELKGQIIDKNVLSHFNINADLEHDKYKFNGEIEKINLQALKFSTSRLEVEGKINAEFKGKVIDSLDGFAHLSDLLLTSDKDTILLDSVVVNSIMKDSFHEINISLPSLVANLKGNYKPSELPLIYELLLNSYDSAKRDSLYGKLETENFDFNLKSIDESDLISFFIPGIQTLDSININSTFNKTDKSFNLSLTAFKIEAWDNQIYQPYISTISNKGRLEFKAGAQSIKQGDKFIIDVPSITGVLSNDSLVFNLKLYDQSAPTRLAMDGFLIIGKDKNHLSFISAQIIVQNREWKLNPENKVVFGKDFLEIVSFEFTEGNQKFSINSQGVNNFEVLFSDLHLDGLAELAGLSYYKVNGRLSGNSEVKNLFSHPSVNAKMEVDSLVLSNQHLGTLTLNVSKSSMDKFVNVKLNLRDDSSKAIVEGNYYLEEKNKIDFNVNISKLPLQTFQSFSSEIFYKLKGEVSGDLQITGLVPNPNIVGSLQLNGRNELGLNFTNTTYRILDQKILFKENEIVFDHFKIIDSLNNDAVINGRIHHISLNDFDFDVDFSTDKFELVNSNFNPYGPLYGTLLMKMQVAIKGPMKDLGIDFDLATLGGTNFTFSLIKPQVVLESPSFIRYRPIESEINSDSSELSKVAETDTSDPGDLNFDVYGKIVITKEATLNMIVDPLSDDRVTAIGDAELTVDFDSYNNMNITGSYVIDTGSYSFKLGKLIRRDFSVEKGSIITWNGPPEEAIMNIVGVYQTKATRSGLVQDQTGFMTESQVDAAQRRLPVDVLLYFKGSILNPEISFDINIPEGGDLMNSNLIAQQLNEIKQDPGQLNKQVLSLIVANRFTGDVGTSGIIPQSSLAFNKANQSVSNALTSFFSKYGSEIGGFDVDVNFESLDQSYGNFAQNAQVKVSREINNRISVSAGGNINLNSNYSSGQFAGDYSIRYRLNHNGSINMNFFRTSFQNIYSSSIYTNQGFSLNFQRNFNDWNYVFGKPD